MLMASCTRNEVAEAPMAALSAIGFDTYAASSTKAEAASGFEADDLFYVKGYLEDTDTESEFNQTDENCIYMSTEVKASGESGSLTWSYSDLKYWPEVSTQSISFFAWSIADDELPNFVSFNDYDSGANFTCDLGAENGYMVDLLVAKSLTQSDGAVELTFSHAMCGVVFYAKQSEGIDENTTITIESIELSYAADTYINKGTFLYSVSATGTDGWIVEDSPTTSSTAETFTALSSSGTALTTTLAQQGSQLYLLPQSGDATATFKYKVATVDSVVSDNSFSVVNTATFTVPATSVATINTMHAFNITISLTGVSFDSEIVDWGENDGDGNIVY